MKKRGRSYSGNPASKGFIGPPDPNRRYSATWHWSDERKAYLAVYYQINKASILARKAKRDASRKAMLSTLLSENAQTSADRA